MIVRPVLCDRCGSPIERKTDGRVLLRFDRQDVLAEATIDHRWCGSTARAPYERIEVLEVEEFLRSSPRVAALARFHDGGSVQRLIRKAERLEAPI